jgi:hypothetical protein
MDIQTRVDEIEVELLNADARDDAAAVDALRAERDHLIREEQLDELLMILHTLCGIVRAHGEQRRMADQNFYSLVIVFAEGPGLRATIPANLDGMNEFLEFLAR